MRYLLSSFLLFLAPFAHGALHYFDNAASGANNGTSWANAWQSDAAVNWASINPGDTVYVSGGTTSKEYHENLLIRESGTSGNYITFKRGQDAGHNGIILMGTNVIGPESATAQWWKVDGGLDSFTAPTNHDQLISGATALTNNIGIRCVGKVGDQVSDTSPALFYFTEGAGNFTVRWIEVSRYTNTVTGNGTPYDPRGTIVTGQIDPAQPFTNVVFEYCLFRSNSGAQFIIDGQSDAGFDGITVRFSWFDNCGEDHFKTGHGLTVHDCIIGPAYSTAVHVDFFQLTGSKFKIYNNRIYESYNAILRWQSIGGGAGDTSTRVFSDMWFYNNIVTEKPGRSVHGGTLVEPLCIVHFDPDPIHRANTVIFSNMVVANNLFANSLSNTAVDPDEMARNGLVYFNKGGIVNVTNAFWDDSWWVNNLIVNKHKGVSLPYSTNVNIDSGYSTPLGTNQFYADYNSQGVTADYVSFLENPRSMTIFGEDALDGDSQYQFNNNTNVPSWTDRTGENFELLASDTVALNTGFDVTQLGITTDAKNNPRKVGGAVDRGPLERQETNLVVELTFDNDTFGNATDSSGLGNDGKRFTLSEYNYPSNKVYNATGAPGLTFRPNFTGNYSDHLWRTGAYGFYGYDGGFFGCTNVTPRLTNIAQMTVMCWARYDSATRVNAAFDASQSGNDTLISGGSVAQGTKGSWNFGRYNQRQWINNTRFVIQTNTGFSGGTSFGNDSDPVLGYGSGNQVIFQFPDNGFSNNGDTTNWYHYAATFSNSVVRLYFNGTNVATGTIPTVTTLTLGGGAARPYNWLGVGVDTHVGTPEYDDETGEDYPNGQYHNGGLDQVRVYDRALSQAEIVEVANSEGGTFQIPEDEEEEPATIWNVTTLNVGTINVGQ